MPIVLDTDVLQVELDAYDPVNHQFDATLRHLCSKAVDVFVQDLSGSESSKVTVARDRTCEGQRDSIVATCVKLIAIVIVYFVAMGIEFIILAIFSDRSIFVSGDSVAL